MNAASTSSALYAAVTSPTKITGAVPEDTKELRHHLKDGKGFRNPWDSYQEWTVLQLFVKFIRHRFSGKSKTPNTTPPTVPVHKPSFLPTRETPKLRATWLGHACYYVEFPGGLRVLFDPVFEDRCSPLSWMGPKRYTPMPCQIEDIPFIDAVVISHSHYDHLSCPTVTKINKVFPNAHFFVPLRNQKWFNDIGIHNVTELDWWESRDFNLSPMSEEKSVSKPNTTSTSTSKDAQSMQATFGCLPCQHTSARTAFDKSHTLWASWSVESGGKKLWFGGDTGYRSVPQELPNGITDDWDPSLPYPRCPAFAQIGNLRGPFDLGLIPIGAYEPRFIMSPMHANPYDSVEIFRDTKCRRALGIHWGTWVLTEEDVLEPPRMLKDALRRRGMPEDGVFGVQDIGSSMEFGGDDRLSSAA